MCSGGEVLHNCSIVVRQVKGERTRQSTSILFVLVIYLFHSLCRTYLYQGNVFVVVFQLWCRAYAPHGFSVAVTTNNGVEALNKSQKSFYLKLSGTRSFSSMLETLVCEFVPEQLLSYSRLHFIYARLTIQLFQHSWKTNPEVWSYIAWTVSRQLPAIPKRS